jgi:sterol 14-demethylase
MFAGHHTSSNTTAWTLLEIARNPRYKARLQAEIDTLFEDTQALTLKGLREIPLLDGFIREALRLHPPLNAITRRVMSDWHYAGYTARSTRSSNVARSASSVSRETRSSRTKSSRPSSTFLSTS